MDHLYFCERRMKKNIKVNLVMLSHKLPGKKGSLSDEYIITFCWFLSYFYFSSNAYIISYSRQVHLKLSKGYSLQLLCHSRKVACIFPLIYLAFCIQTYKVDTVLSIIKVRNIRNISILIYFPSWICLNWLDYQPLHDFI